MRGSRKASQVYGEANRRVVVAGGTLWRRVDGRQALAGDGDGAKRGLPAMGFVRAFYSSKREWMSTRNGW